MFNLYFFNSILFSNNLLYFLNSLSNIISLKMFKIFILKLHIIKLKGSEPLNVSIFWLIIGLKILIFIIYKYTDFIQASK